ncbi:MAG: HYR domain-containing protein [Candidatus Limnocylindria bacterium]
MKVLRSAVTALTLSLILPWTALADSLLADGDGLVPVSNTRLNLGSVCIGTPATAEALIAVRATQHPGPRRQVFADGATVTVGVESVVGGGLSAHAPVGSILLPPDWTTLPNGTISDPITATVTLVAEQPGRFDGTVRYVATGAASRGVEDLSREVALRVRARAADCDAPVITVPADQLVEATGADGAVVDYPAASAMDNLDGPVPVSCAPLAGSTFALGTTPVTCRATDAARNSAETSFNISVVDTTAPQISGVPEPAPVAASGPEGAIVDYAAPTALDLVDGPVAVTCTQASGSVFAVGSSEVSCRASDAAGNLAEVTFMVTVSYVAPPPPEPEPEPVPAPDPEPKGGVSPVEVVPPAPSAPTAQVPSGGEVASSAAGSIRATDAQAPALPDTAAVTEPQPLGVLGGLLLAAAVAIGATRGARIAAATDTALGRKA